MAFMEAANAAAEGSAERQQSPGGGAPGRDAPAGSGAEGMGDLRALPARHQRRLLLQEVRAGRSDLEIGERFGLSQWQVRNLRYNLGLKRGRGGRAQPRPEAPRAAALQQEPRTAGAVLVPGAPEQARRARRLPRIPGDPEAERMGVRLAGRFPAAEAGRRLSALGGLLSSSDGDYEVRLAIHQIEGPAAAR